MHFRYHYSLLCAAEKPLTTLKAGVFPVVVRPKDEVPWTLRGFQILRVNDNPVESVSTLKCMETSGLSAGRMTRKRIRVWGPGYQAGSQ